MNTLRTEQYSDQQIIESRLTPRGKRAIKFGKFVAGVAATGVALAGASSIHDRYVDATTTDPDSITAVANTVPNPTEGGKELVRELLKSGDPTKVNAASHIDASELGAAISTAVFTKTGETDRQISSNYNVSVTIEPDGDIASAEVIDNK